MYTQIYYYIIISTAPSEPPENISVFAAGSTQLNVSWDSVQEQYQNGIIIAYEVFFEAQQTFALSGSINTTEMSVMLSNLQEYVAYSISVRAYTSAGPGPYSVGVSVQTLENGNALFMVNSIKDLYFSIASCYC